MRLYGDNTEAFIDRNVENSASCDSLADVMLHGTVAHSACGALCAVCVTELFALLSKQGFAPTYHGRFQNGRIEGWMDARPLEPEEMGQVRSSPLRCVHA